MIALKDKWCVQIDVTNICAKGCIYCVKYTSHLRKDQVSFYPLVHLEKAIKSLEGWPNKIGFTGGEPLLHPDFLGICELVSKYIPKKQACIFTSLPDKLEHHKKVIDKVFGAVFLAHHNEEQRSICMHQPILLAVGDMVKDAALKRRLIEDCWLNKLWSPVIGLKGAFMCDCAVGIDMALDMNGGWTIEPGWLRESYEDQIAKYCDLCGACLPYPRQLLSDQNEKISKGLFGKFKSANLRNINRMILVENPLTPKQIEENRDGWEPWRNRQDRPGEGAEYYND